MNKRPPFVEDLILQIFIFSILCSMTPWILKVHCQPNVIDDQGPSFVTEPAHNVAFANKLGAHIDCAATGSPKPSVRWLLADRTDVQPIPELREVNPNGTLVFKPFSAEQYRPDVHAVSYICFANNSVGTVVSNDVQIRGVVLQSYDSQVYDSFAIEGNTAVFKCHIPAILSDFISVSAWIKNDNLLIEASNSDASSEKYYVASTGELHISNVAIAESGSQYKCKTTHKLSNKSIIGKNGGRLFVTAPHGNVPVKILDLQTVVEATLGFNASISCVAQGFPVPQISWLRKLSDGSVAQITGKEHRIKISQSALLIYNIESSDGGSYICEASSAIGKDQAEIELLVNVPLAVSILPVVQTVKDKESATFQCKTSGNSKATYSWLHDGIAIMDETSPTLNIPSVQAADKGMYQCMVKGSGQQAHASAELRISGIPPKFISTFEEVTVQPGGKVTLECAAVGLPIPNIHWDLDGIQLLDGSNIKIVENQMNANWQMSSTLVISNAKLDQGGLYTCTAVNQGGVVEYMSRVNIHGAVKNRNVSSKAVVAGSVAFLNCPFYGYPFGKIVWKKNGETLPTLFKQIVFSNGTLKIEDIQKPSDSGIYSCSVASPSGHFAQSYLEINIVAAPKIVPFWFQDELLREGMRARLQCVVSEGDLPLTITWMKDNLPLSQHASHAGVIVRVLDDFSSILTIASISPRHNGNYTCVASNMAANVSHTARLAVNVAPKIVPFSFQGEHLFEGTMARITCIVYQGDLPITIQWLKDGGQVVPDVAGADVRQIDDYTSILTIDRVNANHAGNYTCLAINRAEATSHSAILSVNVPPKIVPFTFQGDHLHEGNLARVSCIISRGDLPLNINWEKDGQMIPANLGVAVRSFDEHSSILSIESVATKHNGRYTCIATNAAGVANYSAVVVVQVPPKWTLKPQDAYVLNGQGVILHCQADGYPKPSISWMHSLDMTEGSRNKIVDGLKTRIFPNGSLVIRSVDASSAGYYSCQASNGIGYGISTVSRIQLQAPPTFKMALETIYCSLNEQCELQCIADGDTPMSVAWYKDEHVLLGNAALSRYQLETSNSASGIVSHLEISDTSRQDNGLFKCVVENTHGKNNLTINLIIQESPEVPTEIGTSDIKSRELTIHWKKPFDGNDPIVKFVIQYIPEAGTWTNANSKEIAGAFSSVTLTDLQPATKYLFRIYAENSQGRSLASDIVEGITFAEAPSIAPKNVRVTTKDDSILTVTWNAAVDESGNGRIMGYYVGYKEEDKNEPYSFKTLMTSQSQTLDHTINIINLNKFTKYAVVVQAYNEQGKGPLSDPIIVMTSEGVPSASPKDVRCTTLASQSIHTAWAPPRANDINGILVGYKVMYRVASGWYDDEIRISNTTSTHATLEGLEKYANYSIQVAAVTKAGDGPYSDPIFCKTLDDVPGAPADVKVLALSANSVLLTWKHPLKPNGITKHFNIYTRDAMEGNEFTRNPLPAQFTQMEIPALKSGHRYEFWVKAVNIMGEGSSSSVVALTPSGEPIPARVVPFDETLTIPWKNDVSLSCQAVGFPLPERKWYHGGDLINGGGQMQISAEGTLTLKMVSEKESGDYSCIVSNDLNQDRVTYTVVVLVPPYPPAVEVLHTTHSSIEIKWTVSKSTSGRVRGYVLHVRREFGEWKEITLDHDVASYKLNGLECGTNYEIVMSAFNAIGMGDKSQAILVATNGSVPGVPSSSDFIEKTSSSVSINLNAWKANSCPILYYVVEYKARGSSEWIFASNNLKPDRGRLVIRDLQPATLYHLRVAVYNSAGSSVAEYDFATYTVNGATISPDVMLQDQAQNSYSSTTVNLWIVISIILSILLIIGAVALACLIVKRKNGDHNAINKGARLSCASNDLRSQEGFPYSHRNTMSRPHTEFGTMSPTGCQDDLVPYATCQLADLTIEHCSLPRMCSPMMARQMDLNTMDMQQRLMYANSQCIPVMNNGHSESAFMFPNMQESMACFTDTQGSQGYPHEDHKLK